MLMGTGVCDQSWIFFAVQRTESFVIHSFGGRGSPPFFQITA
jgi:hypothetical protein